MTLQRPLEIGTSASSITTRIKTHPFLNTHLKLNAVQVHHPLQQGLRHFAKFPISYTWLGTSASSITTRIKTVWRGQRR